MSFSLEKCWDHSLLEFLLFEVVGLKELLFKDVFFSFIFLSVCLLGKEIVRASISRDLPRGDDPLYGSVGSAG